MQKLGQLTENTPQGYDPWTQALADEFERNEWALLREIPLCGMRLEARQGRDSLWLIARWPECGGMAFRTAYAPGAGVRVTETRETPQGAVFELASPLGRFVVAVETPQSELALLHWTVTLTPDTDTLLPFWPSDVYPLDAHGDPRRARGIAHAGQSGNATGLLYLTLTQPRSGSLLYVQNLTALNDLCQKTGTTPESRVGGLWPQLGYSPPPCDTQPLPAGQPTVLSDAWVRLSPETPDDDLAAAGVFLDLLADIYPRLDPPETQYNDWPERAERTLRDIDETPDLTLMEMGQRYLHPYIGAEPPDSMSQLTVLLAMRDYEGWTGQRLRLADELRAGVSNFFDPELGAIRRYLPSVGDDKDIYTVDAWYLYHPLVNLGRLAADGDEEAKRLFVASLDYGIQVARHFEYRWPVMFQMQTLEVMTGPRKEGEPGQSDVGGLYAYVMLQAWDMLREDRYLAEAKRAVEALRGYSFAIAYQMNLTAWGANACLRLWRETGNADYRAQSEVLLASYFHHACFWNSRLGVATNYCMFSGELCLHDGPYMALYECYESFAAFHEYLTLAGEDLRPSLRLLMTETIKYGPTRAWFFYPDSLPAEALSSEVREGRLDRTLSIPLEDLYPDGQPAGQVGQEVYGAGAAFAITTRSYYRVDKAPFLLYSEYPVFGLSDAQGQCVEFTLHGDSRFTGRLRLIPLVDKSLPTAHLVVSGASPQDGEQTPEGHWEWHVPGGSQVEIRWG